MNERPVIAISSCNKPLEGERAHTVKDRYVEAIWKHAEAVPLIVPAIGRPEDAASIVSRVDAIMLTGSTSNVEPHNYRSTAPGNAPFDPLRDRTSLSLIKAARHFGVPIIGVCRGLQEINVALGGTLSDGRSGEGAWDHHAPDDVSLEEMFACSHHVDLAPGALFSRLTGQNDLTVNSVHYQRVETLAAGLRVEATASDGVVEAFTSREADPQIVAVQWHPEWQPEARPHDIAFWRYVGQMARRRAEQSVQQMAVVAAMDRI